MAPPWSLLLGPSTVSHLSIASPDRSTLPGPRQSPGLGLCQDYCSVASSSAPRAQWDLLSARRAPASGFQGTGALEWSPQIPHSFFKLFLADLLAAPSSLCVLEAEGDCGALLGLPLERTRRVLCVCVCVC